MRDPPSNTVRRTAVGGRLTQTVLDFVDAEAEDAVSDEIDDESDENNSDISAADNDDRHTLDDNLVDNTPQKNPDVMRMCARVAPSANEFHHLLKH